jgi:hypothetical protein
LRAAAGPVVSSTSLRRSSGSERYFSRFITSANVPAEASSGVTDLTLPPIWKDFAASKLKIMPAIVPFASESDNSAGATAAGVPPQASIMAEAIGPLWRMRRPRIAAGLRTAGLLKNRLIVGVAMK